MERARRAACFAPAHRLLRLAGLSAGLLEGEVNKSVEARIDTLNLSDVSVDQFRG